MGKRQRSRQQRKPCAYCRARVQELSIPMHDKLGKNSKGLAWLSRDLLAKIKRKKQMYRQRKEGQTPWDKYRDTA